MGNNRSATLQSFFQIKIEKAIKKFKFSEFYEIAIKQNARSPYFLQQNF